MIDDPTLPAGVVVGPPVPPLGVPLGVVPQPRAQVRIRVARALVGGHAPLGAAVLVNDPAGQPLTHAHLVHQVMHGSPAPVRAQKFPVMMLAVSAGVV